MGYPYIGEILECRRRGYVAPAEDTPVQPPLQQAADGPLSAAFLQCAVEGAMEASVTERVVIRKLAWKPHHTADHLFRYSCTGFDAGFAEVVVKATDVAARRVGAPRGEDGDFLDYMFESCRFKRHKAGARQRET